MNAIFPPPPRPPPVLLRRVDMVLCLLTNSQPSHTTICHRPARWEALVHSGSFDAAEVCSVNFSRS